MSNTTTPEPTLSAAGHPTGEYRQYLIDSQIDTMTAEYRIWYDRLSDTDRALVAHPDAVASAIAEGVAKSGRIRFLRSIPASASAEAKLFFLYRSHTGYGRYRPIDSLMMARLEHGAELCELWERTVETMYSLYARKEGYS